MPILHKCAGCGIGTNRSITLQGKDVPFCRHCQDAVRLQAQALNRMCEIANEIANAPFRICVHEVASIDVLKRKLREIFKI